MTVRLALVDYGAGNLASVRKAFLACGAEVFAPDRPGALAEADAIVVPGVGHFDRTRVLDAPWREAVLGAVARCRPLLGICLGMQWLFEGSDEAPGCEGLGLMPVHCRLIGSEGRSAGEPAGDAPLATFTVPHVGWNSLERVRDSALLAGVRATAATCALPEGAQVTVREGRGIGELSTWLPVDAADVVPNPPVEADEPDGEVAGERCLAEEGVLIRYFRMKAVGRGKPKGFVNLQHARYVYAEPPARGQPLGPPVCSLPRNARVDIRREVITEKLFVYWIAVEGGGVR